MIRLLVSSPQPYTQAGLTMIRRVMGFVHRFQYESASQDLKYLYTNIYVHLITESLPIYSYNTPKKFRVF